MGDMMTFPKRWEDFLHDYEFEDDRRIYTNGSRLIPSFRVEQMMEHYAPVRHGRWALKAHDEGDYYRWNVTAECSECCAGRKEIWAGFFPGVPPYIARDVALANAKSVKLSNYCPECGARMDGGVDEEWV